MEDRIQKLELKITELENKLKSAGGGASAIDPKDMEIYQKVSAQLTPKICSTCIVCHVCVVCITCRVCNVCINECSCGPCIQYSPGNTFHNAGFDGFM